MFLENSSVETNENALPLAEAQDAKGAAWGVDSAASQEGEVGSDSQGAGGLVAHLSAVQSIDNHLSLL